MKIRIEAANPKWRAILEAAAEGDLLFLKEAYSKAAAATVRTTTTGTSNQQQEDRVDNDADTNGRNLLFETVICSSGCYALHWVAGNCTCPYKARLVIHFLIIECGVDVNQRSTAAGSGGRTALHYAARNGQFEIARILVQDYNANPNAMAKSGVTPFQLACWRNHLHIAKWLVHDCHVDAHQTNDFDCNALHWLALCPPPLQQHVDAVDGDAHANVDNVGFSGDDNDQVVDDLVPTAIWLIEQCGLDCRAKQRQGHNALHKAAWGGHLALCRYLHDVHNMWDNVPDNAGYYAVDLAEMAHKTKLSAAATSSLKKSIKSKNKNSPIDDNISYIKTTTTTTSRHAQVAIYLRRCCHRFTLQSCRVLNITLEQVNAEDNAKVLRRAYHVAVRRCHPDKRKWQKSASLGEATTSMTSDNSCHDEAASGIEEAAAAMNDRFFQLTAAYRHLMHLDEQEEEDDREDDTNDDGIVASVVGGSSSRRCYRNQKAIPFLLPSPPPLDSVVEVTNDTNCPQGTLATTHTEATCSTRTSAADDESWLTQSRLRIVLQQYGRCGGSYDNDGDGGIGGTNTTTSTSTTRTRGEGMDLSNLRKWWNRCWPDVPLPVTKGQSLKAWIKTQRAVVYTRSDDKGVIRLFVRGHQQQQQQQQ